MRLDEEVLTDFFRDYINMSVSVLLSRDSLCSCLIPDDLA